MAGNEEEVGYLNFVFMIKIPGPRRANLLGARVQEHELIFGICIRKLKKLEATHFGRLGLLLFEPFLLRLTLVLLH
jgi:hypothetical protein